MSPPMTVRSTAADPSATRTVFVSTNLETHLALSVSVSETFADLKKKILLEHPICFPKVGAIEVHALKVKRRGCFYHLPDSVYIINVFNVVAKSWYVYVDASTLLEQSGGLQCNPNSDNQLVCFNGTNNPSDDAVSDCPSRQLSNLNGSSLSEIEPNSCMNQEVLVNERTSSGDLSRESSDVLVTENGHSQDDHCKSASVDTDKKPDLETRVKLELMDTNKKPDLKMHDKLELHGKDHELPDKQTECMVDDTMNGITGTQCNNILLGGSTANKPIEKKYKMKKPSKKRKDAVDDLVSKEKDLLTGRPSKDTLQQNVVPLNYVGNADKEAAHDARMENPSVVLEPCRNSSSDARKELVSTNDLPKGNGNLVQQAEGNNDKSENGVVDVQPNNLLGEVSEHGPPAKKKRKRLGSGVKKANDLIVEDGVSIKHVGSKNDKSDNGIVGVQCNTLLGDDTILVHNSPAKKKRKVGKNNSNKDAIKGMPTPEQLLGEKCKSKNATSDLGAECIEDIHSLRTSSSSGRNKKKSKSTTPLEVVPPILSPVKESRQETTEAVETNQKDSVEPDTTGSGESVLGETITIVNSVSFDEKHDGPVEGLGKDVYMDDATEFNMGAETDMPEEPVKEMDASRSGHVDVKNWPLSTVQEPNDLQGTIEPFDDHNMTGVDQTDILVETRETYDLIDKIPEPASSCKKTKKSKRTSRQTRVMPGIEIAGGLLTDTFLTEHKSLKGDDSSVKSKTEGTILPQLEGNDAFKLKSEDGISLGATSAKTVKRTISKSKAGGDNEDGKKKRKTKKQQMQAATDLPEVQEKEKEQNVGSQSPLLFSDVNLVDFSSKKAKEKKSSKTHSMNPNLLPAKDTRTAFDPLLIESLSVTVNCSQVSSPLVKGSDEKTLEVVGNVDSHNSGSIEEDNQMEVSGERNRINFKDYFIGGKDEQEVKSTGEVVDNKINKKKKSDRELKDKKHKHKLDVHPGSASPDARSLLKVNENQGNTEKALGDNSSTIKLHGSSLKNESGKPLPQPKKKLLKPCESGILLAPPKNSRKSNPVSGEARKSNVPDASVFITPMGKNIKAFAKQTSSLESSKVSQRTKQSSKHPLQNNLHPKSIRKASGSGSNMGEVVNNTNPKSLLAASGAIFKDDSSIASRYDQAGVDSDATTRTPSDNLSSSDGEGSYSSKLDEGVYENSMQSRSAVPKNMTLGTILRSSSRYKKVKLSASQSQLEDIESQPLDFVPDSQADA